MRRFIWIVPWFAIVLVLATGVNWLWGQATPNPVVQWQSVLSSINNIQAEIAALQAQVGAGGGGTGSGAAVLDSQAGNPYFQANPATSHTTYSLYSYNVPGGTLGTNKTIVLDAHLQYLNVASNDDPSFSVTYGSTTIAGGQLPTPIPASGSPSQIELQCSLGASGTATTENGLCTISVGGSVVAIDGNSTMTENSANALSLTVAYNNGTSSNSTIQLYSARVTSGTGVTTSASSSGANLSSYNGPLSVTATGGSGIQNAPLVAGSLTAINCHGTTAAASGLVRDANGCTTVAARNAANTGDLPEVGPDAQNNVVLGGAAANSIQFQNSATVNSGSFTSAAYMTMPATSQAFTGTTDTCTHSWSTYTLSANSTITLACPGTANIQVLNYQLAQPSTGSTYTYTFVPQSGATLLWIGGSAPTPCSTNGCIDRVEIVFTPAQKLYVGRLIGSTLGTPSASCPSGYTCYYFDSVSGNDSNTATQAQSSSTPWATITKAVAQQNLLGPGIAFLFKTGDTWTGQEFQQNQNIAGSSTKPAIIGSYGTGARPFWDENGANNYCYGDTGYTAQYLIVEGIECTHAVQAGIYFDQSASSTSSGGLQGLVITNNYVHNTGGTCYATTGSCLNGTESSLGYQNQINAEDGSGCTQPGSINAMCAGNGVQITNNIVRYVGGHDAIEDHNDYGAFLVSANVVGPGVCSHEIIDTKNSGNFSKGGLGLAKVTNNIVDNGVSLGDCTGSSSYYTENTWNPNSYIEYAGNLSYDSDLFLQVCSSTNSNCGSSACPSGNCNINVLVYNNTQYANYGSTGQYGIYGPYDDTSGSTGTATMDVRNNIFDGGGFAYTGSRGSAVLAGEDYNDCGGKQGTPTWFTSTCSGAHDLHNVDPLYISPGYGQIDGSSVPNFKPTSSQIVNGGQPGLVTGNNDIGAY